MPVRAASRDLVLSRRRFDRVPATSPAARMTERSEGVDQQPREARRPAHQQKTVVATGQSNERLKQTATRTDAHPPREFADKPNLAVGTHDDFASEVLKESLRYTRSISSSGSICRRSESSVVTTTASRLRAARTTEASITSAVRLRPQRTPAAFAIGSSSDSTSVIRALSNATSGTWRDPSRQACPSTPAGTINGEDLSSASRMSALIRG